MKVAIHQSQYLPWPPYFRKIAQADCFVLMDDVQYQKNGVQNRNRIRNRQGAFWLTIPVSGSLADSISEKVCAGTRWRVKHWKSIQAAYGRSKYWSKYADGLAALYQDGYGTLGQANERFLKFFFQALEISTPIVRLSTLGVLGQKSERVLNICRHLGADIYLSGRGASAYLEPESFEQAGIRIEYMASQPPVYEQPYDDFIPGLSMIDMLMHAGPEQAIAYLGGGNVRSNRES